jgi:hypothetical protein
VEKSGGGEWWWRVVGNDEFLLWLELPARQLESAMTDEEKGSHFWLLILDVR